ncbi:MULTISPECIES: Eco29kI family restriction endonuclease [Kitasatospora]|uniref:Putative type II restriction enzyme n=1 Tax=Kitasatospora setae (strain ATCC 33774 / DSM 43861 / JCM 3304 / KCC A-0304 / NBRC 14216 / KM-6054) TaxID=452652 RepID=E4NEG3_KITSK|nr:MULTISPECIES: Eco29kI family restriction endonuclease [Kitasatospora]BAJ29594.1 putative type II restriction enzyme [Kitasatospora setae KM-6054]
MSYSPSGSTTAPNFNPLSLDLLSRNLREELDRRQKIPLDSVERFTGAGLYALYYKGDLPLYQKLKEADTPIYIGKAEAGNSSYGYPPDQSKPKLFDRIADHRASINQASNLDASHFDVRYLVLDDIWIVLGERALLRAHSPVLWNTLMTGFGANASGMDRKNGRSIWDSIHPGRARAKDSLCYRKHSRAELVEMISKGIEISLMPPGSSRSAALENLRNQPQKIIWSASRGDDKRTLVYRVDTFIEENEYFEVSVDATTWRHANEIEEASHGE